MDTNKLLRKSATAERNFNAATLSESNLVRLSLIEEKLDGKKLNAENQDKATMPDGTMLLAPIYFLAFTGALIFLKRSKSHKAAQNRITNLKRLNQIPCRNCRFFKENQYLKCAVHPSTVLKEEAVNCPDYCSQKDKFTSVN